MSGKKVSFGKKPTKLSADDWVENREVKLAQEKVAQEEKEEREPMKRLTIDIPESLHREIKAQCAMRGSKIADEVRYLLMKKYRNTENNNQ